MKCKGSKTIILVFFSIRLWLEFLLSLCKLLPYPFVCCIEILCIIPLFIYHLFWCGQQGCSVVGASHRRTGRVVGLPQGDIHKILIYHKQQIVSYRIEEAVSLNSANSGYLVSASTWSKINFLMHVIITIIQTRCIYGNIMCSRPIYWLGCLKSHFSMKKIYLMKWLQNIAIIY